MPSYKYKFKGSAPVSLDTLGIVAEPGQTIETTEKVNHPDFEIVKDQAVSKEDK